jgi:hypothetical protein
MATFIMLTRLAPEAVSEPRFVEKLDTTTWTSSKRRMGTQRPRSRCWSARSGTG